MIIGLDVGGTHIDAVIIKDKKLIKVVKEPYKKENLEQEIFKTLNLLLSNINLSLIKQINLSTTISTNSIIENKTDRVGMIIQNGPGLPNEVLKITNDFFFISGYTDHRGIVVREYNKNEINEAINYFKANKINAVGVATKFSTRNPKTETDIKDILNNNFNSISLSHTLSGRLNFKRRINTTYLNASIYSIYERFVNAVLTVLDEKKITAPVYVLKADGGIISLKESLNKPVETILSGPAASLMGFMGQLDINGDGILLDIGGTTTDIFIVAGGMPLFEPLGIKIANYNTLIRSVYSFSVGLGGDSSINIANGKLIIGPKREGTPYSLGGPKPTLTDAFVYLGKLDLGSKEKAKEAISSLAKPLSLSLEETAKKIISLFVKLLKENVDCVINEVNNKPIYTIKELLYQEKITPTFINVMGGPAKLLTPYIKEYFNLNCTYLKNYQVANAIGAALSKITGEINLHIDTHKGDLIIPELSLIEKINRETNLVDAKKIALKYLSNLMKEKGYENEDDLEIVFASSFNMISGFYTKGKNIRVTAQVRPGLIYKMAGDNDE